MFAERQSDNTSLDRNYFNGVFKCIHVIVQTLSVPAQLIKSHQIKQSLKQQHSFTQASQDCHGRTLFMRHTLYQKPKHKNTLHCVVVGVIPSDNSNLTPLCPSFFIYWTHQKGPQATHSLSACSTNRIPIVQHDNITNYVTQHQQGQGAPHLGPQWSSRHTKRTQTWPFHINVFCPRRAKKHVTGNEVFLRTQHGNRLTHMPCLMLERLYWHKEMLVGHEGKQ